MKTPLRSLLIVLLTAWSTGVATAAEKKDTGATSHMVPQQQSAQPDNKASSSPQPPMSSYYNDSHAVPQQQQQPADLPQVETKVPQAPDSGGAPDISHSSAPEPAAQQLPDDVRVPDHLIDDAGRIDDALESGRAIPDARLQDEIRGLFDAAEQDVGSQLDDVIGGLGSVDPAQPGLPGQGDAEDVARDNMDALAGAGKYASGTREFSQAGQGVLRARINQFEMVGWTFVRPPGPGPIDGYFIDRGTMIGPLAREAFGVQPNVTEIVLGAYNEEGEYLRFRFWEGTGRSLNGQETVYFAEETGVYDLVGGNAADTPKTTIYNHWDRHGNQVYNNTRHSDGKPNKPGSGDGDGGSSTADAGGKDTGSSSGSDDTSGSDEGKDTASDNSGDSGDSSGEGKDTADTGGESDGSGTSSEGKDAAADAGDAGTKELTGGSTGGDDPRSGEVTAGTPDDLPGLSQHSEIMRFIDLSDYQLADPDDLAGDPDSKQGQGGGGTIAPMPRSVGPGARPGPDSGDPDAPRMRIDPDDLATDPIPEDLVTDPGK